MKAERIKQIIQQELRIAEGRIIERIEEIFDDENVIVENEEIDYSEGETPLPQNKNYRKTLELLNEGKSQSEIAKILGVSIQTTRRYINWLIRNGHYEDNVTTEFTDREEQLAELVYRDNNSLSGAATLMGCTVENAKAVHDNLIAKGYLTDPFIKTLYPDFFKYLSNPRIGFPSNRYKLASQVRKGQLCYIYLTTPCKKVVAMVKVISDLIITSGRWPYVFDVEVIIPPKKGVTLSQVGINKRLTQGTTHICISEQINTELMNKLKAQPSLTDKEIQDFIDEVDKYFTRYMHQN
ncbi:winged helix-turn-helix transcriptional regulator [Clostridium sp. YIM B02551]|uniref:winged helix-turn-helix transcriptional regulator n=1 Tax=Clostridium sp. YIM B02551 TaxID=2910679 RepID=UPI001EECB1EB|nr:helix-turn-helix domain-containing protein [Clostridium sp. YIM B02551]